MSKHCLVIGAGVIGLSAAYYLMRRGHRVTILEREAEPRDGCSFGNAGMIVPSHFIPLAAPGMVALGLKWMWNSESPFYVKPRLDAELLAWGWKFWRASTAEHVARSAPLLRDLSFASRACFEELAELTGNDFGLVKRGLLMLCKTAHAFDEEARTAARARELGVPAEVLDAKQAAALDPGVRMDIAGAIHFPQDCHLSPGRFMAVLQRELERGGAAFSFQTEVTGWRVQGRRVEAVRTTLGEFAGDEIVLCGGAWSPAVARGLRLSLPMQAGKGYSLTLPRPRQLPELCAIFAEARVAVTPMGGALRFGGTMEIAGLNSAINPARVRGIINAVPHYFPDFTPEDFAGIKPWCGLRPCSPDGLPFLGRCGAYDNLSTATGHAMMGLSLGPISGRLIAEILSGEPPSIAIPMLSPDRYRGRSDR
jgi:D-amino-acid dehydrogenase